MVLKLYTQGIRSDYLRWLERDESGGACACLSERRNGQGFLPTLEPVPIGLQFFLVQFRLRFDQSLLPLGQRAGDKFHGIDSIHCDMLLIIGMEMRDVMAGVDFDKHANDDPKEAAEFRPMLILENRPIHRKRKLAKHRVFRKKRDSFGPLLTSVGG